MARQIKFEYGFQSVNGIVKKHYYLHDIPNIKEKCDVWNVLPIVYVRQFTGLHDKNGKEIYEGYKYKVKDWYRDEFERNTTFQVVYSDCGFWAKVIESNTDGKGNHIGHFNIGAMYPINASKIEIISNIHESEVSHA